MALKDLYTHLTPIQRVNIARHPNRPTCLHHIFNITEKFVELHGDRGGYDDPAIITGLGSINGRSYMFIGQQKGRNTKENIMRNFGMPTPHGWYTPSWVVLLGQGKARADDDDVDDGVGSERTESDDGNDRDMSVPYNVVSRGSLIIKG